MRMQDFAEGCEPAGDAAGQEDAATARPLPVRRKLRRVTANGITKMISLAQRLDDGSAEFDSGQTTRP